VYYSGRVKNGDRSRTDPRPIGDAYFRRPGTLFHRKLESSSEPRLQLYWHDIVRSAAGSLHGMSGEHPAE
jgi:hypothetical protein